MYEGKGKGKAIKAYEGKSSESLDDAIRAAVGASNVKPGTTMVVTHIEVVTVGDPNVGSYKVILTAGH